MPRLFLLLGIFWITSVEVLAQSARRIQYTSELGGYATPDAQIPYWLRANQYGIVPIRGSLGTLHLSISSDYRPRTDTSAKKHKSRFDWGFGVSAVANVGPRLVAHESTLILPEAYGKVRFGKVELFAGNRREVYGLGDTVLTSGFVAWSGNALPFPKIQLHTPDFVSLGFTKHLLAFRAGYAHGWFANTYIQGSYLHQKYLYVRLGKPTWKVRFVAGLNHQVQWGGHAAYLIGKPLAVDGHLPTSFQDYLSLVIGHYPDAIENDRFTEFDGTNRVGNHIGNYDVAVEWNGSDNYWQLYHQHIYEDASGLALQNVPDGLTGLRFLNRKASSGGRFRLNRMVVEWLSTTNQSGPTFDQTARWQGGDNYFNHSQYVEGWSYKGRTLGTPFIAPYTDLAPNVASTAGSFYPNNRIVAWYTAAEGAFRHGPVLKAQFSYSRNFGTFSKPYPEVLHQFSALASAQWSLSQRARMTLTTSFALDRGDMFPDSFGSFVSVRKVW